MRKEVIDILNQKTHPKEMEELLSRCKGLVGMSRNVMRDFYPVWDRNEAVYRGERVLDNSDRQAVKKNEPAKVYVPMTHTQIQTFVSFMVMVLTQRDYFYELSGSGPEDEKAAKLGQATIQRDLEYNKFTGILLPQFGVDVAVKGLGIFKTDWLRETVPVEQQVPDPDFQPNPNLPNQTQPPMITQYVPKTKYLGNRITVISPYRWFPDTRIPLTRYRYGEFCADEIEYSMGELKSFEEQGLVAGLKDIPRIQDTAFSDRRFDVMSRDGSNTNWDPAINSPLNPKDSSRYVLITEVQLKCNPSKTKISENEVIDPAIDAEVVVIIWIANDGRIIRIQDSGYQHNEFLYDAAQFFNDQSRVINPGLAELIAPMQDILDWLMNSRVTNVRKVIQNQLVVDSRFINMEDLKQRNPVIRVKGTPDGLSIDQYIKQLNVQDVTLSHLTDMNVVGGMVKETTGLQENLLGQYAEGRRSAREASNVNANAAARVMLPIKGLWQGALLPLGRKLLCNLQQGLDVDQLVSVVGVQKVLADPQAVAAFIPVNKSMLVGNYDFLVFDATLPSQRMAIAAALAQAGDVLMKNPSAVLALGIDPKLIFMEWLELMGVKNAERFQLTQQRLGELVAMAGLAGNAGGAQPSPGQGQPSGGPPAR